MFRGQTTSLDNLFLLPQTRQRPVCCGQEMPAQGHRRGLRRQIHQEAAQQVEPARRDARRHRARGEHPEGDPAPQRHHAARGVREQGGRHPHPGAVSPFGHFSCVK